MTITAKFAGTCKTCGGPITVGQAIEWERGAGSHHVNRADCHAPAPAPELNVTTIAAFLAAARDRGLKFPKLRVLDVDGRTELRLGLTGEKSRVPGSVTVKRGNDYLGLVRPTGQTVGLDANLVAHLATVAEDPAAAAKRYAVLMGRCCFCNLELTDEGSVELGYGPICAAHWGLPHSAKGVAAVQARPWKFDDGRRS